MLHQDSSISNLFEICHKVKKEINLEQLENLLKNGADPNELFKWDDYTFRYTGEKESLFSVLHIIACTINAKAAAEILLKHGAKLDLIDPHTGNTVLLTAISLYNEDYVNFLIRKINDHSENKIRHLLDQKDHKESNWLNSPLTLAFKKGLKSVIQSLIAAGANVNQQDRFGCSALHWAALWRYDDIITQLLKKNDTNIFLKTKSNRTAFEFYTYEFRELDSVYSLDYNPKSHFARITFKTNFPELSDVTFHGLHREANRLADEAISKQFEVPSNNPLSLSEQYEKNFKQLNAIARTADKILGYEYDGIRSILKKESDRIYGKKITFLPDYAALESESGKKKNLELEEVKKQLELMRNYTEEQYQNELAKRREKNRYSSLFSFVIPRTTITPSKSDVSLKKTSYSDLPWEIAQNDAHKISLKLGELCIHFKKKSTRTWLLSVCKDKTKIGMLIEEDDIKKLMEILAEKNINGLLETLRHGKTAQEMLALIRKEINLFESNQVNTLKTR